VLSVGRGAEEQNASSGYMGRHSRLCFISENYFQTKFDNLQFTLITTEISFFDLRFQF
jgi:hypothetical protein